MNAYLASSERYNATTRKVPMLKFSKSASRTGTHARATPTTRTHASQSLQQFPTTHNKGPTHWRSNHKQWSTRNNRQGQQQSTTMPCVRGKRFRVGATDRALSYVLGGRPPKTRAQKAAALRMVQQRADGSDGPDAAAASPASVCEVLAKAIATIAGHFAEGKERDAQLEADYKAWSRGDEEHKESGTYRDLNPGEPPVCLVPCSMCGTPDIRGATRLGNTAHCSNSECKANFCARCVDMDTCGETPCPKCKAPENTVWVDQDYASPFTPPGGAPDHLPRFCMPDEPDCLRSCPPTAPAGLKHLAACEVLSSLADDAWYVHVRGALHDMAKGLMLPDQELPVAMQLALYQYHTPTDDEKRALDSFRARLTYAANPTEAARLGKQLADLLADMHQWWDDWQINPPHRIQTDE